MDDLKVLRQLLKLLSYKNTSALPVCFSLNTEKQIREMYPFVLFYVIPE